ncbi:unnamed protein product [Moneuplotes crassus]|uniref:CAP-Gly domain-containing protein n=1 Tax=Euplotes crassus TaxID=5936 RepID=A0AAD1UBX6_EUPCR|nr:unnamed protein product [Moneuplotes crassus]
MESTQDEKLGEDLSEQIVGTRICLKGDFGTIRYFGKLQLEKAGDDHWYGVEWDRKESKKGFYTAYTDINEGIEEAKKVHVETKQRGNHNGTVEGVEYFTPIYNGPQDKCCSFIREGKLVFGTSIKEALEEKYQVYKEKTEEEKQKSEKEEEESLFVGTNTGGQMRVEVVGVEKSYNWRTDISKSSEVALQSLKIDKVGPPGTLRDMIPICQYLYLDNNLLWNWDQFFLITRQLKFLHTLNLSGNRFKRIDDSYMAEKNVNDLINPSLKVLVLNKMQLDWSQIHIIAPALTLLQELHLCENNCSKISSEYEISKDCWRDLIYLNLEDNKISGWEEIQGFRKLKELKKLGLGINLIQKVEFRPGFRQLTAVDLYQNLIDNWESIDQLNNYFELTRLRLQDNPITSGEKHKEARDQVFARIQYLKHYNGSAVQEKEKNDCEQFYVSMAYKDFLENHGGIEKAKVESLEDLTLGGYMTAKHPRFYELVEKFKVSLEHLNSQKEDKEKKMKNNLVSVKLISQLEHNEGKTFKKKLLPSMIVENLKGLCCKLFKVDILSMRLRFRDDEVSQVYYDINENLRQLSFYGIGDGCEIYISSVD